MKKITSANNSLIKTVATLLTDASARYTQKQFVAEGFRTCKTLIESQQLQQLFVLDSMVTQAIKIASIEKITIINDQVLKKISNSKTPSGIVGLFTLPKQPEKPILGPGIVLANISDPGNMGTLIRTAAAFNKKTVIIIEGVDPWSPKVVQASAGTIGMISVICCDWQTLLKSKGNLLLYALIVTGGKSIEAIEKDKALLVIGNEARGISPEWLQACDEMITLPMPGGAESLNAAVAGSIAMYVARK